MSFGMEAIISNQVLLSMVQILTVTYYLPYTLSSETCSNRYTMVDLVGKVYHIDCSYRFRDMSV